MHHLPCRPAHRLRAAIVAATFMAACVGAKAQTPFISELRAFAFGFCPRGWAPATGQLLTIGQNQTLFALMGTTYGGNGQTTFGLPDLRGRAPLGQADIHPRGQQGGVESTTLNAGQLPPHTHALTATTAPATRAAPVAGDLLAQAQNAGLYVQDTGNTTLATAISGSNQPIYTRDPFLAITWCVSTEGVFPSAN